MKWVIVVVALWGGDGGDPFTTVGEFPTRAACEAAIPSVTQRWGQLVAERPELEGITVAMDCKLGGRT